MYKFKWKTQKMPVNIPYMCLDLTMQWEEGNIDCLALAWVCKNLCKIQVVYKNFRFQLITEKYAHAHAFPDYRWSTWKLLTQWSYLNCTSLLDKFFFFKERSSWSSFFRHVYKIKLSRAHNLFTQLINNFKVFW